jgi:hypothetical protein
MPIAIHINAGNDRNGNPRRGWIITEDTGRFVDFIDEGHQGTSALQATYSSANRTQTIDVLPSVYREAMRQAYGNLPTQASQTFKQRRRRR